jgi:hypothetical protein
MNLIVFDCDNTIWKTPYEEDNDFMKLNKSIDEFNFEYINDTLNYYYNKSKEKDNKMVILTNRSEIVKDSILDKLKKDKGIKFDYCLFRIKDRSKSKRLSNLIDNLDNVRYIEFYDDKNKHLEDINSLKNKYPGIKIKTIKIG